jgi:AAA+ ATPase superfamily predicted ATPase
MMEKTSAFKVGGRIEPPYFLDREKEIQALAHDALTLSQSNVVIGPRRFGKTALLHAVQRRVKNKMLSVYANCLPMTCHTSFHDRVVGATLDAYERQHGKGRRLLATWRDVLKKPVLGMRDRLEEIGGSLEGAGAVRLKFRTREADGGNLLEAAFDFLESFASEQRQNVLLILDEFQSLASFGDSLFALLKDKMDNQRHVAYLFSGSSLGVLHEVFGREGKSPLYQMVGRLFLDEIEPSRVGSFYQARLENVYQASITDEAVAHVARLVGGVPYYFQKLGVEIERRVLVSATKAIGKQEVKEAFAAILEELSSDFQERWITRFSDQQRSILKALAAGPGTLTEIAAVMDSPPENLTYNLKRLRSAMILSREGKTYRITDRVFAAWLHAL